MTTNMWFLALADIGENTSGLIIKNSCAEFDQNGTYYLVLHHQLQLDLGNVPAGESYVQTNKQAWVAQSDRHDLGQTVNDSLKLTSMHATKQAVSCLP